VSTLLATFNRRIRRSGKNCRLRNRRAADVKPPRPRAQPRCFAEEAQRRGVALTLGGADSCVCRNRRPTESSGVLVNLIKNAIEAAPHGTAVGGEHGPRRRQSRRSRSLTRGFRGISPEARPQTFSFRISTNEARRQCGLAWHWPRQIVVAHGRHPHTSPSSPQSGGTLMRVVVPDASRVHPDREGRMTDLANHSSR